ncbi:hypothetical protein [Salinicoccus sp. CNSTN-B1]
MNIAKDVQKHVLNVQKPAEQSHNPDLRPMSLIIRDGAYFIVYHPGSCSLMQKYFVARWEACPAGKIYREKLALLLVSVPFFLIPCISPPSSDLLEDPSPRQNLSDTSNNVSLSLDKTTYDLPMQTMAFHIHNAGDAVYTHGEFFYIEKQFD